MVAAHGVCQPPRAVRLARAALLGAGTLSEEAVRTRVATRFPAAAALPDRPALDELLGEAVDLVWFPGGPGPSGAPVAPGFGVPSPPSPSGLTALGISGSRYRTGTAAREPDEARHRAEATNDHLRCHAERGGYLVVTVGPSRHQSAIDSLVKLGASPVNVDELLIGALRRKAEEKGIRWEDAIVATDATGPAGPGWGRLLNVVNNIRPALRASLLGGAEHVLVTYPGLLARYGAVGLLDELRELTTRSPEPGQALRTPWVLVPAEDPDALPVIAGQAVPVTSDAERLGASRPVATQPPTNHRTRSSSHDVTRRRLRGGASRKLPGCMILVCR